MAQNFVADFARPAGPPLVKDKFGVYQTPFLSLDQLVACVQPLGELGVQNLRYEIAWGKPDTLAHSQISGTAQHPMLDFSTLDRLMEALKAQNVRPLLALTYTPDPLKTRADWGAWQDMPDNLNAWAGIVQDYAAHLRAADGLVGPLYEVWNEPDTPVPGGKMFFTGDPDDYGRLYAATAPAVYAGDSDASVGGPAIAYDMRYFAAIASQPMDFASVHAYDNYSDHLAAMRAALASRPDVPIFLTEYASYDTFGKTAPVSRYTAAERFFRDVNGLLEYPDVTQVYWAQWVDDSLGMITNDGHKKALFNAFKIYGMMPVDRAAVTPAARDGVAAMASADSHTAAVVLWNENLSPRSVAVALNHLPMRAGTLNVFRIDAHHASYIDDPQAEDLTPTKTRPVRGDTSWVGSIPGESVVFLRVSDGHAAPHLPAPGVYVRSHYWFPNRSGPAYADFDPRTFTARLGMGGIADGTAAIGVELAHPARRLRVQVQRTGSSEVVGPDALLGLHLDFSRRAGGYGEGILLYAPGAASFPLPWNIGSPERVQKEMASGKAFTLNLTHLAPAGWDGGRILITFILRDGGAGAQAKFTLANAGRRDKAMQSRENG